MSVLKNQPLKTLRTLLSFSDTKIIQTQIAGFAYRTRISEGISLTLWNMQMTLIGECGTIVLSLRKIGVYQ